MLIVTSDILEENRLLEPPLSPAPPMLGRLCLPGALWVEVVSHFWIYSTAVPQIGPSEANSLFEEDP